MEGQFRPGERLDPATLADELLASTTPVREALNQLLGEGLLETRLSVGFSIPLLDEPALKDLYAWSSQILILSVRNWPNHPRIIESPANRTSNASTADRTATLFCAISQYSSNTEHRPAISRSNARLHAVRLAEESCLTDIISELDSIEHHFHHCNRVGLKRLLASYHRRREKHSSDIIREAFRRP